MTSSTAAPLPLSARPLSPDSIAALAEQCVKCGLCLPHCPTYRVMKVEGESPRGRIAFAHALANGIVPATPALREQLDDCTACMTCEVVCPSKVRYSELLTKTRSLIDAPQSTSWLSTLLRRTASLRAFRAALKIARHIPWESFLPRSSRTLRAARLLTALPKDLTVPANTPAVAPRVGMAAVFRGCIASTADAAAHRATVQVLSAIGYDVIVPTESMCCGALDHHVGDVERSTARAQHARAALDATYCDVIIGSATGCQRQLAEHVRPRVGTIDVLALLAQSPRMASGELKLHALPLRAAWLAPCTQADAARSETVLGLLRKIPELVIDPLPLQPRCCGAAGTYFIDHPHIAEPLRAERIEQLAASRPDILLTTNVGCRLYLAAGLRDAGLDIPAFHPIELIARALPT